MADKIGDVIDLDRFAEPDEIQIIREFLQDKFNSTGQVKIQDTQIIISVHGAALAGALRVHLHELQQRCNTKKRLVIRIN